MSAMGSRGDVYARRAQGERSRRGDDEAHEGEEGGIGILHYDYDGMIDISYNKAPPKRGHVSKYLFGIIYLSFIEKAIENCNRTPS